MKHAYLLVGLLALSSCGKSASDPGPGGVTAGEARALDQAATMLDERRPPADASTLSETEGPHDEGSEAAR